MSYTRVPVLSCTLLYRCCRRCGTSYECRYGASPGVCLRNVYFYIHLEFVFLNTTAKCDQSQCSCVNYCAAQTLCIRLGGYCVKKGVACRRNYVKFDCGCRDPNNCSCCVPSQYRTMYCTVIYEFCNAY